MGFRIRQIAAGSSISASLRVEALERVVPFTEVQAVALAHRRPGQRRRKLPAEVLLLVTIVMNLYTHEALDLVLVKLIKGLRLLWADPSVVLASKSALCQGRARLGARPVVDLFHRVCQPMASATTPGAFLWGLRVLAVDGTVEAVPDSAANAAYFGRHHTQHGGAAFPQLVGVYLVECGTHAIVDAGFWPCHTSERKGGLRLLRSVGEGMLLLWDCGFHSFTMAWQTRRRQAHFLGRVPSPVLLPVATRLPDGSYWAWLQPTDKQARAAQHRLRVRVIVYTLTDPRRPGCGEVHRLVTSLLDPRQYPSLDLICAYHERWEVEVTIDELDTHQRLVNQPLRSQRPVGVLAELYGLLLAHYAVRVLMLDAADQANTDVDRLSFLQTVRLLGEAIPEFQMVVPTQHPALYTRLLRDIQRFSLPPRAPRSMPRVVKRQQSKFARKRECHRGIPRLACPFRDTIALLPAPSTPAPPHLLTPLSPLLQPQPRQHLLLI